MSLTGCASWAALGRHYQSDGDAPMTEMFAADPQRASRYSLEMGPLYLDYSKNRIDDAGLALLFALARERHVEAARDRMFTGEPINITEGRAVLHTALRNRNAGAQMLGGVDINAQVRAVLERMTRFADNVRSGHWRGFTGQRVTDVVNIGIGGSHLGPQMVTEALAPFASDSLRVHFVANVDATDIVETLRPLDVATTLFVIASKSFTTQETMVNAASARRWFLDQGGAATDIAKHFVAVSTNADAVADFGIDTGNMFGFWDWVGGRYSLWSAIGLPIMLSVGARHFEELLDGAHELDNHFRCAPLEQNMPVILALLGIWYVNFHGASSHAILPYDAYLRTLPDYLQQADMESNGKRTTLDGATVDYDTGPVIWGSPGTNGQHAYFQLLHQGTRLVPADFILSARPHHTLEPHHRLLVANCLAQSEALMTGRSLAQTRIALEQDGLPAGEVDRLAPHRAFPGNRPSNTILLERLDPRSLGALIALYEQKIFVQGVIWAVNSFDQWGVELGKTLANAIVPELESGAVAGRNPSTAKLIERITRIAGTDRSGSTEPSA